MALRKTVYVWTRDIHLYAGLFLSPLILVFAVSVILLVHGYSPQAPKSERDAPSPPLPTGIEKLEGRARIDAVRPVLERLGVAGEVGFVRYVAAERKLIVPVTTWRSETIADFDLSAGHVRLRTRPIGVLEATIALHKLPGPHLVALRGNSPGVRVWRWLADGAAYGLLFLCASGFYLWLALRAERRAGIAMLIAGALLFGGLVYALAA